MAAIGDHKAASVTGKWQRRLPHQIVGDASLTVGQAPVANIGLYKPIGKHGYVVIHNQLVGNSQVNILFCIGVILTLIHWLGPPLFVPWCSEAENLSERLATGLYQKKNLASTGKRTYIP